MQTLEYTTIDKSGWGKGPWQHEVDKRQWRDPATGLPCMIRRAGAELGHWCGYVGIPHEHPFYGREDIEGLLERSRCHVRADVP